MKKKFSWDILWLGFINIVEYLVEIKKKIIFRKIWNFAQWRIAIYSKIKIFQAIDIGKTGIRHFMIRLHLRFS